jgi:hypothetical protein
LYQEALATPAPDCAANLENRPKNSEFSDAFATPEQPQQPGNPYKTGIPATSPNLLSLPQSPTKIQPHPTISAQSAHPEQTERAAAEATALLVEVMA